MNSCSEKKYLVSSCLIGLKTRYDGASKPSPECCEFIRNTIWVPVCPEQLGGLPTPRLPSRIHGGDGNDVLAGRARVINSESVDVTENFVSGAYQVLSIAENIGVDGILFKSRSPSCGCVEILGVTAALLKSKGFLLREF